MALAFNFLSAPIQKAKSNEAMQNQMEIKEQEANRGRPGVLAFTLIPAVITVCLTLLIGYVTMPPRYAVRATFAIDWNEMPLVLADDIAAKIRNEWRRTIIAQTTALPTSEQKISDWLDDATLSANTQKKSWVIAKSQKWLSVKLSGQSKDCDTFVIEMRDANPGLAQSVVRAVLMGCVSELNNEARVASAIAAARSKSNLDDLDEQESESKRQSGGDTTLGFDLQRMAAGLSVVGNVAGVFGSPVKVAEEPHVEKQNYRGFRLFLMAAVFGAIMAVVGFGLRRLAESWNRRKTVITEATPARGQNHRDHAVHARRFGQDQGKWNPLHSGRLKRSPAVEFRPQHRPPTVISEPDTMQFH
jgi:hypothetical protein